MDTPVGGLTNPTGIQFASDGKVFIPQSEGKILVLDGIDDPSPKVFADLSTEVFGAGDRGILGMKLDPGFPAKPYVYIAYAYDAPPGGTAPTYGDICPSDPDACVISGRLSRLEMNPSTGTAVIDPSTHQPKEDVLVSSWCQQFTSHSIGDIEFDPTGALVMSGGEGGSFATADKGQFGNPCGDPADEGGALRSQDVRTAGDQTDYSGSIIRVDPATGDALPTNPNYPSSDVRARRIIAHGFRNPFRIEFRPGTSDLYVGDVGWEHQEELDRIPSVPSTPLQNFGWPCYEGPARENDYDLLNVSLCESLYSSPGAVTAPLDYYGRTSPRFTGDACDADSGAASSGLAFYQRPTGATDTFPASYDGALFMADAARGCIWVMRPGSGGVPDPSTTQNFATRTDDEDFFDFNPVDIVEGPDHALYVPNFWAGEINRIRYFSGNQPPVARLTADKTYGPRPLTINFSAAASTDADGDALTYNWDLDGDGQFDDATGASPQRTYTQNINVTISVRVSDGQGGVDIDHLTVFPGDEPPSPQILTPATDLRYSVGDLITFSGTATDPEDGTLPDYRLSWKVRIVHCPSACHYHPLASYDGTDNGLFTAPEHEYPSHLQLTLTARDTRGMEVTVSQELDPKLLSITLDSAPAGVTVSYNDKEAPAPFTSLLIAGSSAGISAPDTATIGGSTYRFAGWSDGGDQQHTISPDGDTTLRAIYEVLSGPANPGETDNPGWVRLRSKPSGLKLRAAGSLKRTPFTASQDACRAIGVFAPKRARFKGHVRYFKRWSDGGNRAHQVSSCGGVKLTAVFAVRR